MPNQRPSIHRPIFLVGTMRCGTTMVAEMLGQSRYIAHCPFELKDVWSQVAGIPMASPKTRDSTCPECTADDIRTGQREALTETFRRRMASCSGKAEGAAFLNKNPHLCNKLPLVKALFPDARFIWIKRGLPQVVASVERLFADVCRRQQTWHWWPFPSETTRSRCWNAFFSSDTRPAVSPERIFPGGNIRFIAEYWLESNRAVFDFFNRLPPESHIEVAEEAVLADPVKELAVVAAKLEIPIIEREQMGNGFDLSRNDQWHGLLDKPQLEVLGDFVSDHAAVIDGIFSGGGRASRYLDSLRGASSRQYT
jgi:hypothetical protein